MRITKAGLALALALAAIILIAAALPLSVTNFTQVHIDQKPQGGTATPRFMVDNLDGPSVVAEFRTGGGTPVARFPDGGGFELLVGAFTNSGNQTITGILTVTGATNLGGNLSSQTGALTITDSVLITNTLTVSNDVFIDGASDEIQLIVSGFTTQTTNLSVFEQSDGTDVLTITNAGAIDAASTIQFGADDNFALGYATSAQEIACISATITGTGAVTVTGVTTPSFGMVSLITDPGTGAGDPFLVTYDAPTTGALIINVWQDDASAGTSGAVVNVCAIGEE